MNKVYISKKNFDIVDEPGVIAVDASLAPAISKLNKKNYITRNNHCIDNGYEPKYVVYYSDNMDMLDKYKLDKDNKIEELNDDYYFYLRKYKNANIFIEFKKEYKFTNIPEGFEYIKIERKHFNASALRCNISIVDDKGKWITPKRYEQIKEKYLSNLEKWVDELPIKKGL